MPAVLNGNIKVNVVDIELHKENVKLSVNPPDDGKILVALKPFSLYGISGLSFSGTLTVDDQNRITGYEEMKMKGFPGLKIKSVEGTVSSEAADIIITVTALKDKVLVSFNYFSSPF